MSAWRFLTPDECDSKASWNASMLGNRRVAGQGVRLTFPPPRPRSRTAWDGMGLFILSHPEKMRITVSSDVRNRSDARFCWQRTITRNPVMRSCRAPSGELVRMVEMEDAWCLLALETLHDDRTSSSPRPDCWGGFADSRAASETAVNSEAHASQLTATWKQSSDIPFGMGVSRRGMCSRRQRRE